jgi:hypothetical protein
MCFVVLISWKENSKITQIEHRMERKYARGVAVVESLTKLG